MPLLLHGTHLALLGCELKEQQNDNQGQQMSIIWLTPASTDIWPLLLPLHTPHPASAALLGLALRGEHK